MVLKYIDLKFHYPLGRVLIAGPPRRNRNRPENKQRRITSGRGVPEAGESDDFNAFSFMYAYIHTEGTKTTLYLSNFYQLNLFS